MDDNRRGKETAPTVALEVLGRTRARALHRYSATGALRATVAARATEWEGSPAFGLPACPKPGRCSAERCLLPNLGYASNARTCD
jgi:hypothetical protein